MSLQQPLTYLFVPGNRPERFAKALASGADRVILDLEDAVAPADKVLARESIASWVASLAADQLDRLLVRINDVTSPCHLDDLLWLQRTPIKHCMLSKCELSEQVAQVLEHMPPGSRVLPLIETVRGVLAAPAIGRSPGVSRLAFGSLDYLLDLDLPGPGFALDAAALAVAMASRAADLPPPVAGVTPELDATQVQSDLTHARALGFGAKMCIHPSQVAVVREAFRPDAQVLAWATRVVNAWQAAATPGAIQVDGRMVDKPVVLKAQRILSRAEPTA
ncbi:MAG: CoA ester lyase [Rhodoferax sp.]|jgi:citrate lyase subunit beta/citryl-CoA lyase|uniref:HpcH/HpaI aldolase/citrate lyase family protein n=1 Tax=Rhodoferax sp. TaxID=50421 RepID=UPI001B737BC5|nr:CoA ester lyase [Rhodoferax sp.]MBP9147327.1 CoA ester lyase [Rhodoferax sp.]MBP9736543.1 CoA ester lyase [Rhodoferax sp.]